MSIVKIYVDLDGVLCDFEKRYTELYGHISDQVRRTTFRSNFSDFIATNQFATLEPMPDFHELKAYLDYTDIPKQILSSTAYQEVFDTISEQKKQWLTNHNVNWPNPLFVPGKKFKYQFASPKAIIIDDTLSVIEDWRNAGGIAIHHKSAKSTIAELEMYIKYA
jgi:hypothetical protein